jgi:4'-phosphopantetheinyl transferase
VNALYVVVLAYDANVRELRGAERVAAKAARAREAVELSARATGAELGALAKDVEGAPLASNGWHWSLSHADHFAAGAVARSIVGVDVEHIEPRNQDVVPRVTSRDELELLGGFRWETFFRVWTAKEAVLKKTRVGLADLARCLIVACPDDERMIVAHGGRDHVVHQRTRGRHVAAVTHDGAQDLEIVWSFDAGGRAGAPE